MRKLNTRVHGCWVEVADVVETGKMDDIMVTSFPGEVC